MNDTHTTTACATGCRTDDQPRPATVGILCAWCWQRLRSDIAEIPTLITHLRAMGEPHAQAAPMSDDTHRGDPAEGTVLPAPWLEADSLESLLTSWARVIIEEHPNQPMRGPNAAPWHGDIVDWITPHLEWAASQEWAHEMRRELSRDLATLKARWPTDDMTEPARHVPDVRCPRCNHVSLTYAPPTFHRQPFTVACGNPDCARIFNEDEWAAFVMLATRPQRRTA